MFFSWQVESWVVQQEVFLYYEKHIYYDGWRYDRKGERNQVDQTTNTHEAKKQEKAVILQLEFKNFAQEYQTPSLLNVGLKNLRLNHKILYTTFA